MLDHQPHPDRSRVPARGAKRAEMRPRRGRFVEVERLRVEASRKRLDFLGREGVAADLGALAHHDVLPELHDAACPRRASISEVINIITRSSLALNSSNSKR